MVINIRLRIPKIIINKKMRCYPTDIHIITRGFYTTNLFEEPTYLEKK